MKNIKLLLLALIAVIGLNSCAEEVEPLNTNYITFAKSSYSTGVDVGSSTTLDVTIYTANTTSSDRTFGVSVDANNTNAGDGSYSVPTSVMIPSGTNEGTLSVELSDVNLGIGVNNLVLNFDSQAELSNGGSVTISYIQNCNEVTATLDIAFDNWGSEVGWQITDALDGIVVEKAAGTYSDGQATASESFALCSGRDYTFTITDAFGDGLSDPADGSYTLSVGGVVKANGGGNYGTSDSTSFDTN